MALNAPRRDLSRSTLVGMLAMACGAAVTLAADIKAPGPVKIAVDAAGGGKAISTDLIGIFFEDINDAADGGLYAELVQNRSFEYTQADNRDWRPLTSWRLVRPVEAKATLDVAGAEPLNQNNAHYAVLTVGAAGAEGSTRVVNEGFGGIAVKAGETYDFSLHFRQLEGNVSVPLVRLELSGGETIAEAALPGPGATWSKQQARLTAKADAADAKLVLVAQGTGKLALDMISLFPTKTFKNRPNGLRADLAQTIADLKPKFMRFPGGCVAHGNSLANMYRWKDTVGPVEQRRVKPNLWGYQQGYGLGYFEYFQFCEDAGMIPVPVVAAGVSCQFAPGGQKAIPMDQMDEYVQEVLDLVEWANGPADSKWGKVRADAGHPAPFNLKYIGVGNEDAITPAFRERLAMIEKAVKAKHPDIVLIGTSGPFHSGPDFTRGWDVSRQMNLKMVDEHYYVPPAWLLNNAKRYDTYDRNGPTVYLGEYAAHDIDRRRTLRAAITEAAFLTGLERNADVVRFASYAPLLGKLGRTRWDPNLIYFTNTQIVPTLSYEVQKLFGNNIGDRYLATTVDTQAKTVTRGTEVALGTWNTQAEFDDVKITSDGKPVFTDTFDAAAGEILGKWQPRDGRWRVSAEKTYAQTGRQQPALSRIVSPPQQGDYTLSLRARKTGGAEGFLIGFGSVDEENGYWWNLGGWGNNEHAVEKIANGEKTPATPRIAGRIEPNRWYDIRVEVAGNTVKCFLDNKLVHEFRDDGFRPTTPVFASTVRDSATGDVVLKLVNAGASAQPLQVDLSTLPAFGSTAQCTVLTGQPMAENGVDSASQLKPATSPITVGKSLDYTAPAYSFSVVRLRAAPAK